MERQTFAVSSDSSVMHEGRQYSFLYKGIAIENALVQQVTPNTIGTDTGDYDPNYIANVREVKEPAKEWEIMEFFSPDLNRVHCKLNKKTGGYYSDAVESDFTLSHMLGEIKSKEVTIHAVRRLSDDTTWRVGDTVVNDTGGTGKITEFRLSENLITVNADCFFMLRELNELKRPEPLFTTADGKQVPPGATIYFWFSELHRVSECKAEAGLNWDNHYSTRAAAQAAYDKWLFEQPVLTFNDVITYDHAQLKKLIKYKMGKK